MKTVSFQGTSLSSGQRRALEFQRRSQAAFLNDHLRATTDAAITAAALLREKEDLKFNIYCFHETQELMSLVKRHTAPSFAEWMGF